MNTIDLQGFSQSQKVYQNSIFIHTADGIIQEELEYIHQSPGRNHVNSTFTGLGWSKPKYSHLEIKAYTMNF